MKIALVSANISGIDEVYCPPKQTQEFELFYYSENTLPFPLPNLDARMKGKYLKTQSHKFLDHDILIWIDSSIEIINKDFIQICIDGLEDTDIVISQHKQRKNVYEELEYVIDQMKAGDKYLLKRYYRQPLYQEYEFYRKEGLPKDIPVYNCFFFARWNNPVVNMMFDNWFDLILRYSNFDQTEFSYAVWKEDLLIHSIDTKELFIRNKHINYNL